VGIPDWKDASMKTPQEHEVPHLSGSHRRTYEAIFRHPVAHDLKWRDVRSLLAVLGEVTEASNGSLKVMHNGQTVTLHAPKHKEVASVEDLMEIRHFLQRAIQRPSGEPVADGTHLLVVIDHQGARVYRTETHGSVPQRIVPYDPHGFGRHLHSANMETDGKRAPENKDFYASVAKTLRGADQVLVFGSGTGESSAMEQLLADLKRNHADVAARVIGSVAIDEHHMSEGQLLAKAREFYAKRK
jgi:hypothetical protein